VAIRTRSLAELNRKSFEHLIRNTNGQISLLSPGSIARALVENANIHLEGFYESLSVNHAMAFLSQATGPYLDLHAAMFGIRRRGPVAARIQQADNVLRFYVSDGTLAQRLPIAGNLNRGLIPKGTRIWNEDSSIIFEVEEDTEIPGTATEYFVSARALSSGTGSNVGAFTLRNHDLGDASIKVVNTVSIETGRSEETDADLRARISARTLASQGANSTAIRFAALSVPGVADVIMDEFAFGAGSFKLVLVPQGNRVPVEAIQRVDDLVRAVVGFGTYFEVHEPKYLRFQVVVSLRYGRDTLEGEQFGVRTDVQDAILDYFSDIRPGGEMVITELGSRIKSANQNVYDYRIEALCLNGRHQLLHNVTLGPAELFLPDSNLSDPVRVI